MRKKLKDQIAELELKLKRIKEKVEKERKEYHPPKGKLFETVLHCKKCGKPFKGYILDGILVVNSKHPELNEFCPEHLPPKTKKEMDRCIGDYNRRCFKCMN